MEETIYLFPTNENEVKDILMKLKPKKSPGQKEIHSETLKEIVNQILSLLTYLINKCIEKWSGPENLKTGVINPLFKNGDKL